MATTTSSRLGASGACWVAALYFYLDVDTDWTQSAALSRDMNRDCVMFDMYARHDVWHVLSAAGLFFVFVFFLAIDDGVQGVPRSELHIF